ncbi:MAG: hypothetical protein KDK78_07390 [Chlamydiia bacterium]|nr:hypothetical protein [Chlamydiia bacterium]
MTQAIEDDLHVLSKLKAGERLVFQDESFEVKPKYVFWVLDWFRGHARLGAVFEGIQKRLSVEGLDSHGMGEDHLIDDLSSLRAQVQRMKRSFDAKHGFFYKLFFDSDVDNNYEKLVRQIDYLLARLAKRELDELYLYVSKEAERLRDRVGVRFHAQREDLDQRIRKTAQEVVSKIQRSQAVDNFMSWQDDPGVREVQELWETMWEKLDHALEKGQEISQLISEETASRFISVQPLSVNHHNEILSRLLTWEGIVKEERRGILLAMQKWNSARNRLLKRFQEQYEQIEDSGVRAENEAGIQALKDLFVERERTYLSFLEEAQRGLGAIADQLQDGIRRLGKVLMTDEYLDARVAA